jgi:streptogramin lyase
MKNNKLERVQDGPAYVSMGVAVVCLSAAAMMLSGCAGFTKSASSGTTTALTGIHGSAHGGQQPVAFSSVQIYEAGNATGYGAGAKALLATPASTDASGNFTITAPYQCDSGSQVYFTATGGQPLTGVTNNALALMTGFGLCDDLNASSTIEINEVTTVATVWALAPFLTGSNAGAPASNTAGLASAFADINTLVDTTTGVAKSSTTGVVLPTATLNTIANSLAACVNTNGASSTGCTNLFNAAPNADSSKPSDTITAALNIARNPSRQVQTIINNGSGFVVFSPTIASATDLTLGVTYKGGGINAPTSAAIDSDGNVWIANSGSNSVTELTHTGTLLSGPTGYLVGGLNKPSAIAFDTTGNAWVTNFGNSTLTELNSSGGNVTGSPFSGGGLSSPTGIAFDALGNSWITNSGNSSVSEFSSTGTALSPGTGYKPAGVSAPVGVAVNPH